MARNEAFLQGFRNGLTDARLGIQIEYSATSQHSQNEYTREYSQGYRAGQAEESFRISKTLWAARRLERR
jgi:hypothetical protein